jgi:dTDP-4-amino-4,6-dideoxygalactose transaminase
MNEKPIVFGQPWFSTEEEELVLSTLRSGWIGQGPLVEEFERRLAEYLGVQNVVTVNSCTAALHLSLVAAGLGPGDEVVTTGFTFVATLNAIEHTGATAVLVDVNHETLNIDVEAVARVVTPRTRAVMPVHFGGLPVDTDGFAVLAERHDLWVIEDAAHALGAVGLGCRVGASASDRIASCFSFYPNKTLASAEGGAVSTANSDLAQRIRELRLHGLSNDAWRRYRDAEYRPALATVAGFKSNWTDLQAAIGLPQLERLEGFLATRETSRAFMTSSSRAYPTSHCARVPKRVSTFDTHSTSTRSSSNRRSHETRFSARCAATRSGSRSTTSASTDTRTTPRASALPICRLRIGRPTHS